MSKLDYRPDIDGLRAVALLSVLLFHLDLPWFSGGFVGVDVFFVISGYLISSIVLGDLEAGTFSFKEFYLRRFRRIFPALGVTMSVCLLVGALVFSPLYLKQLGRSIVYATGSLSNVLFWSESNYFDSESSFKPLLHTWSLSVEEQFYLLWPLLLALTVKAKEQVRANTWIVVALTALFSWAICYPFADAEWSWTGGQGLRSAFADGPATIFFLTPFRVFEFALGALCIPLEKLFVGRPRGSEALSLFGWLSIVAAVIWFDETLVFPSHYALLPCLGAAALIMSRESRHLRRLLDNGPMTGLGKLSYSLYLVHWPLIAFYKYFTLDQLAVLDRLGLVTATLALGWLLNQHVERRFRYSEGVRLGSRRFFAVALLVTGGLVGLAVSAWLGEGWRFRVGDAAQLLTNVERSKDFKKELYGGKGCEPPRCEANPKAEGVPVYVIGDSYSRAYFEGLRTEFPRVHFIFFEDGGCEFYTRRYIGSNTKFSERCKAIKKRAYTEIRASSASVILSQHWESNSEETQRSEEPGLPDVYYPDVERYARFVATEFKELRAALGPRRWIVLGGPPKFGQQGSPVDCLTRPIEVRECSATARVRLNWHERFNESLARLLPANISLLDPYEALCDASVCNNVTEAKLPIYSDYGHLSRWGSRFVVERMKQEFGAFLERTNVEVEPRSLYK